MQILESDRLVLRPFTLDDDHFIVELLNTEAWIKYIGERNVKSNEEAREYLENGPLKSYELNGFGLSMVQRKMDNAPIGMCGLIKRDYLDHPDIGFAFLPNYTGQGYAFEITAKLVEHGLNQRRLGKIFAICLPSNQASINLLEKIGFVFVNDFISADTNEELCLYSISHLDEQTSQRDN